MQSKRTVESAVPIWRREDPNYPGVPQPPPEVVARSTSRSTVDYDTYVLRFSRELRLNALLMTVGIVLIIGAMFYLSGIGLITVAAVGVGLGISGFVGYMAADRAHSSYTRDLAVSVSETYERPTPPPQPQTVRPFVASGNGTNTVRVGRFSLPTATWAELFETAGAAGGKLTRDAATRVLPRPLYRDWQATLGELQRLGYVDDEARPTAAAWDAVGLRPPHPGDERPAGAYSTHARRTHGAHGASDRAGEGEWGE